jgi:hypothetical protein
LVPELILVNTAGVLTPPPELATVEMFAPLVSLAWQQPSGHKDERPPSARATVDDIPTTTIATSMHGTIRTGRSPLDKGYDRPWTVDRRPAGNVRRRIAKSCRCVQTGFPSAGASKNGAMTNLRIWGNPAGSVASLRDRRVGRRFTVVGTAGARPAFKSPCYLVRLSYVCSTNQ